jgi:hypothetical protein
MMFLVSPLLAEKMLLSLYVVIFALGFRFFIKQVSAQYELYSILCFPFIYNVLLYFGFFNFILGFAVSLFFFGLFLKWRRELNNKQIFILMLLSLFAYFSHLLAFVFCGFFAGFILCAEAISGRKKLRILSSEVFKLVIVFVPGLVLSALYFLSQTGGSSSYNDYSFVKRCGDLLARAEPIAFMGYAEGTYITICLLVILTALLRGLRNSKQLTKTMFPYLLILVFFSFLLYAFVPDALSGGSVVVPRVGLYFFIFLLALLSCVQPNKMTRILLGIYMVSSVALLIFRWQVSAHASAAVKDFLRVAGSMEKNSLFYTIKADPLIKLPDNYHLHTQMYLTYYADAYLAMETGGINMRNYEVHDTSDKSYFATEWKKGYESGKIRGYEIGSKKTEVINFDLYNKSKPRPVEYILLYAEPGGGWHDTLSRFIPSDYTLVSESKNGYTKLFRFSGP